MRWLEHVCASRNDSSCETLVIGKSSEQRDLKVIKVRTELHVIFYTRILTEMKLT